MTDQRLRDLLADRVVDLPSPDLGASAWQAARRIRQRRAVVSASAAVVVVVVGVTALIGPQFGGADGAPPAGTPTPSVGPAHAERGGTYARAQVWWAPPVEAEGQLPQRRGTPLPGRIDLSGGGPAASGLGRVVAAYEVDDDDGLARMVVVGADGTSYALEVSDLDPFADAEGNRLSALSPWSLSPDGRHLALRQPGALAVYDFGTDAWTRFAVIGDPEFTTWTTDRVITVAGGPDGTGAGASYDTTGKLLERLRPASARGLEESEASQDRFLSPRDEAHGRTAFLPNAFRGDVNFAYSQGLYLGSPVERDGTTFEGLDGVAVGQDGRFTVLVQPASSLRWKGCCPQIGWIDDQTVLFESRHAQARVLAWRVGTADLSRVSDIRGWEPGAESYVGSYAATGDDPQFPDGS